MRGVIWKEIANANHSKEHRMQRSIAKIIRRNREEIRERADGIRFC